MKHTNVIVTKVVPGKSYTGENNQKYDLYHITYMSVQGEFTLTEGIHIYESPPNVGDSYKYVLSLEEDT